MTLALKYGFDATSSHNSYNQAFSDNKIRSKHFDIFDGFTGLRDNGQGNWHLTMEIKLDDFSRILS